MSKSSATSSAGSSGFCVGPEIFLRLKYLLSDAEGEAVEVESEQLCAIYGMGQLLPVVERAIDGLHEGDQKTLSLAAKEAFGDRDPEAVLSVARDEFPADVAPGDHFEAENNDGGIVVLRVLEVDDEGVVLDANHPLAGQDLKLEVTLLEVRPATQDELELALAELNAVDEESDPALIDPERLLRGLKRR